MKLKESDLYIDDNKLYINNARIRGNDVVYFDCIICGKETHKRGELLKKTKSLVCGNCNRKKTNLKKYGVENPLKSNDVKKKMAKTKLSRYGKSGYNNRSKAIKTNLEKYGVENPSQVEEVKIKKTKTLLSNYGVKHNFENGDLRNNLQEKKRNNFYVSLIKRNNSIIQPLFKIDEYIDSTIKYRWMCKKCGNEFEDHLNNGHIPRCFTCYPKVKGTSKFEEEIYNFIKSLGIKNIITNSFSIIPPKQLDFYLPDYKLAIEFNGLYWHSELNGKEKNYHLEKTIDCENKGIKLIHIFEDEWINKQSIVKSIIKSKLGHSDKIYARKCTIKEIGNQEEFIETNHLQGYVPALINLGLYYQNELVSLLTFGKSRFNKKYDFEILRYVNKLGFSVIGGFPRLLKHFKNTHKGSIITYSDKRYFDGLIYKNNGFIEQEDASQSYFYIKSPFLERYNRQQFQKHKLKNKLEIFDPQLTEWENMQLNGWDRIWDCGNKVFTQETNYET